MESVLISRYGMSFQGQLPLTVCESRFLLKTLCSKVSGQDNTQCPHQ